MLGYQVNNSLGNTTFVKTPGLRKIWGTQSMPVTVEIKKKQREDRNISIKSDCKGLLV
ncbi:MAG: hypothetical protein ACD_46C00301G0001 [uncultured bacterium]|nr:MAG: hypothetical protein ACD_46C00301G0001 [uncultured bacterium]